MLIIHGIPGLVAHAGQELGVSQWFTVRQADVDAFAAVTRDHQWIHVDVERAAASPFGGTIAHGYLTLSLLPSFQHDVFTVTRISHGLNYGLDRVRFPSPAPVGCSIRARVRLIDVHEAPGGAQARFNFVLESDASEKPVCVADTVVRYYAPNA